MPRLISLIIICCLFTNCQTYKTIIPTISGEDTRPFTLKNPIVISFKDSREKKENSKELIESLKRGFKLVYGNNIEFQSYFEKSNTSTVTIKINIKEIGANFGVRSFTYNVWETQVAAASSSISTNWGTAVATAVVSQPVLRQRTGFSGYWVGTSYLDLTIVDNFNNNEIFSFPFIGEDVQPNTWGYKSGKKATEISWNKVSSNLLDFIDALAIKMIESE